ncbi:hypothetical protein JYT20_00310 [Rhodothermus sp. AH-315-K08]|nr:hypothetical protein [Rhodothermus sp. AH-315-K08]
MVILLALLLASCSAFGGNETGAPIGSYLPLQVGNMWAYRSVDTTSSGQHWVDTVRVFGTAEIDGAHYVMYGGESRPRYVRTSGDSSVMEMAPLGWGALGEIPWLLFDLKDGSTYQYRKFAEWGYTVTVSRGVRVETPSGVFEDCIRFDFYQAPPEEDAFSYTLAPGVGVVAHRPRSVGEFRLSGFTLMKSN